jgi:hypothetical protein
MSYRDDLAALSARHDALSTEVAHKTRELEQASRLLDDAKARARLPVLDNIRVASPCSADWAKMTGDERTRHCGDCKKNVYNLSDMTRDEAEALIVAKEGRLCVRYFQRTDGTILLKDCSVGVSRKRRRRIIAAGAAALLVGGGVLALRTTSSSDEPEHEEVMMGAMAAPIEITVDSPEQLEEVKGDVAPVREVKGGLELDGPHVKMGKLKLTR